MRRSLLLLAALTFVACNDLPPEPDVQAHEMVEPDVFDVIRASNSKAAVAALRDRYAQEVQHARLLEARIGELIAAEEGLSSEHHDRLQELQAIKDQVRTLADEQLAISRALDEATRSKADASAQLDALKQENSALEQQIAAELARRDELRKQLEAARKSGSR